MQTTLPKPLTLKEVCELFGISRMTLWRWLQEDPRFPKPFTTGNKKLWNPEKLREFMEGE